MSNKEYYLMNVFFVALLFALFLIASVADASGSFISCQVVELTGNECSSCGLTRDFISFTHFNFKSPINDKSIFVFVWFLAQFLMRIVIMIKPTLISQKLKWYDLVISASSVILLFLLFWN